MEKMFTLWRFYTLSSDDYMQCMKNALKQNINSLLFLSIAYTVFLLIMLGYSATSILLGAFPVIGQRDSVSYLLTILIMSVVSVSLNCLFMYRYRRTESGKNTDEKLIYFLGIIQFIFATLCSLYFSVWTSPDSLAVTFLVFLVCSTFLIVISPLNTLVLVFGAVAAFVVSTILLSNPTIWVANIFHGFATGVLGVAFTWVINMYKLQALSNAIKLECEYRLNARLQAKEKEYYFAQCKLMQESAKQVRTVQHDIKNHLAVMRNYTTNGNYEEVRRYLDSLMGSIEKSETYSDTSNIVFDSIINYKLRNAKNDNIKLDLRVAVPPEINSEVVDIVTILGNLLDNALEAVAKTSEKFIKLDIEFGKGGLFLKVENSFNGEVNYDTSSVENTRQIKSLKNGEEHGFGLKNIQQSIEKYDGYMKISHTENIFSVVVFLYVDGLDMADVF